MNYYNEIDPFCCGRIQNLIDGGSIPDGFTDGRSITEVQPADLVGFTQHHFFCGQAGWPEALRLAGWPSCEPAWSCSCPCQPVSGVGKRRFRQDARHLWPEAFRLIRACRPRYVLGEQVSSGDGLAWWDDVANDLEGIGYTAWATVIDARLVGCPQRRRRIYWAAYVGRKGVERQITGEDSSIAGPWGWRGQADLQSIASAPFVDGDRWPQPLIRTVDDGVFGKLAVRAAGNAIVPQVAAEFIRAFMQS